MAARSVLVALDQGTSVTRASVYRDGRLVASSRRAVGLHFPHPGRAEQDPRELAEAARETLAEACGSIAPGEHAVLGIANQRSTIVAWDAETGRPLGPALSWRDSRAQEQARALAHRVRDIARRTGLPASPHYGGPKIAWMLQNWPEARAAADAGRLRVGPVSTWLAWKLGHGECFAVDPTNAQRMLLMNLATLDWDPRLVRACGVPPDALPQVRPTDGMFGEARIGRLSLPIHAMLGDQQAALVGMGPLPEGRALVQLGTGGFVLVDSGSSPTFAPGLLAGIGRADANRARRYIVEGPVNSAGSAFDRLKDVGLLREDDDLDALVASSTSPATFVPAWAGLAAPWWAPSARAVLMDWHEATTRADIVAGVVRGLAFLVADILDFMLAAQMRVSDLVLSGPVSRQACVAQAIADASSRDVLVRLNPEATLEGIACALAEGAGQPPPELSLHDGERFRPRTDLSAARAAFAAARLAATKLARATEA